MKKDFTITDFKELTDSDYDELRAEFNKLLAKGSKKSRTRISKMTKNQKLEEIEKYRQNLVRQHSDGFISKELLQELKQRCNETIDRIKLRVEKPVNEKSNPFIHICDFIKKTFR